VKFRDLRFIVHPMYRFSLSYGTTQYDRIVAWYCRLSVCLSVCLWRWYLWLNDISYSKVSEQVIEVNMKPPPSKNSIL